MAVPRYHVVPPVTSIEIYSTDVVVKRTGIPGGEGGGPRKEIRMFTDDARKRLAWTAANTPIEFVTMVTLTYPRTYPEDGRACKQHLRAWLEWQRRTWDSPSYLWFLEFQARGAPHFHILTTHPMVEDDKPTLSLAWYKTVNSGDARHWRAGTRIETIRTTDGAKRYAVKYALKMRQKTLPPGFTWPGRFYGYSRDVKPYPRAVVEMDENTCRALLADWKWLPERGRALYPLLYGAAAEIETVLGRAGLTLDLL